MTIKGLARGAGQPDRDDQEARHRRHEEREVDRAGQRNRELMCLPLEEWPIEHQLDLEFEVAKDAASFRLQPAQGRRFLPGRGSFNPVGQQNDAPEERS